MISRIRIWLGLILISAALSLITLAWSVFVITGSVLK